MMSSLIIHLVFYLSALMYMIIVQMVLVQREKVVLCHNALVTTHVFSVMVFVSHIVMIPQLDGSTPVLR
jgi:hypothetical protein